jgi:transposase
LKPHLSRYWLNTRETDPAIFQQQVETVCDTYAAAEDGYQVSIHTVSTDEMTGIQALERLFATKPVCPGQVEKREFEYKRHGTQTLIANFEVATGDIIAPTISNRRTEMDFAQHIARTIAIDPEAEWVFVVDQLNIHQSETLVQVVAAECTIEDDLGIKGKTGILESMASRMSFLSNPCHRIRFVYTPKHSSWLNQIEIWFSILVRRLLKRASFTSIQDLKQRILDFIDYFNRALAKPFKWTYTGRPLKA